MNRYLNVLMELLTKPRCLQSDFCRYHAFEVAEAASRGHITSMINGRATNRWRLTTIGSNFLDEHWIMRPLQEVSENV